MEGLRDDQRKSLEAQPSGRAVGVHVEDIHDGKKSLLSGGTIWSPAVLFDLFANTLHRELWFGYTNDVRVRWLG